MPPLKFITKLTSVGLLLIAILIILPNQQPLVQAIKCYVCQSNIDPKCADPFDNLTLPITDCDSYPRADLVSKSELEVIEEKGFLATFGLSQPVKPLQATMCRKIRQKTNGEWRTIRECGYLGPPGDSSQGGGSTCQMRHGTYDVFMEVCTCNTKDGCNSTGNLMPNRLLLGLLNTITVLVAASLLFSGAANSINCISIIT